MFAGPNPFEKIQTSGGQLIPQSVTTSLFGNFGQQVTQLSVSQETTSVLQQNPPSTQSFPNLTGIQLAAAAIAPQQTAQASISGGSLHAQEEDIPSAGTRPSASSFGAGGPQFVTLKDMNAVFNQQQSPIRSSLATQVVPQGNVESISTLADEGAQVPKTAPELKPLQFGSGGIFGGGGTSQQQFVNDSNSKLGSMSGGTFGPNASSAPGGMIRFHTSQSQPPGSFIKMGAGGFIPSVPFGSMSGGKALHQGSHPGEVIPSRNFTYHSIGELESLILEHQTLSFDLSSSSGKLYRFGQKLKGEGGDATLLALSSSTDDNDMHLIINQQDLYKNLIAPFKQIQAPVTSDQAGIPSFKGTIIDFAVLKGKRLFLLYQWQITILDISHIVKSSSTGSTKTSMFDTQPQYMDQIQLSPDAQFTTLEAHSVTQDGVHSDILILSHSTHAAITLYISKSQDSQWEDFTLKLDDSKSIRDLNISGHYLTVLLERNEIQVIDLRSRTIIFKSVYKDANGKLTRVYYLDPRRRFPKTGQQVQTSSDQEDQSSDESLHQNRFKDDILVGDDDEEEMQQDISELRMRPKRLPLFQIATQKVEVAKTQNQTPFSGFFIFLETLKTKDSSQKNRTQFEKLSIAKVVVKNHGNQQTEQSLQKIDTIKISDKAKKILEFDEKRGIIFLMNQKTSNLGQTGQQTLKLYTIKLKQIFTQAPKEGSDSEDQQTPTTENPEKLLVSGVKFSFIKGMHLQLNNNALHSIKTSKSSSAKKPKFFKSIFQVDELNPSQQMYFLYTSLAEQIIVHQLDYAGITERIQEENIVSTRRTFLKLPDLPMPTVQSTLSTGGGSFNYDNQQSSIFGQDPFAPTNQIDSSEGEEQKFDPLPTPVLGASVPSFGVIPISDKERDRILSKGGELSQIEDHSTALLQELLMKAAQEESDKLNVFDDFEEGGGEIGSLNEPLVAPLQDDVEEVNRELNEAIRKEMEMPIINAQDEFFDQNPNVDEVLNTGARSTISIEEEVKEAPKPERSGKEIVLSAEQMKIIQQSKQQQQQAQQPAATQKKKKKAKNKAAAQPATGPNGGAQSQPQVEAQPKKEIINTQQKPLTTQTSASQLPFITVGPPQNQPLYQQKAQDKSPTQSAKPVTSSTLSKKQSKGEKPQEEQLLESLGDLTKKYQELAQKFGKLQDQLTNMSQQQLELERCVSKNIQQVVPTMIEQQMRERIVPSVVAHMKGIDRIVKDEVLPQVENQMQDVINKLIKQNKIKVMKDKEEEKKNEEARKTEAQIHEMVEKAVVEQFSKSMETQVKPMLVDTFKSILDQVNNGLLGVNDEFNKRLKQQDEINKELLQAISQKHEEPHGSNLSSHYGHYPPHPHMAYPPYPPHYPPPSHPAYYPPPQYMYPPHYYHPRPPVTPAFTYAAQIPDPHQTYPQHAQDPRIFTQSPTTTASANISPMQLYPYISHYQHSLASQALSQSAQTAAFISQEHQGSYPTAPASTTAIKIGNKEALLYEGSEEGQMIPQPQQRRSQSQMEEIKLGEGVPTAMSKQPTQIPINAKGKSISSNSSSMMSLTPTHFNNQAVEMVESPKKKQKKGAPVAPNEPKTENFSLTDDTKKKWGLIPYMKEVATQGKSSQADFLLCGSDTFLSETVQFVQENSHIITNQYTTKIIHQFIKKVYRRAKENDKARRGALAILNVFIEKIYRVRENMKQLVCQANQWEAEIKQLVEEQDE